jgi:signal transduction histidine kinase
MLLSLFLVFFTSSQILATTQESGTQNAEVKLDGWDPEQPMRLKGKWLVLPGELFDPADVWKADVRQRGRLIEPGQSLKDIDPSTFPQNKGYATYILFLDGIPQQVELGLDAPSVFSAAKVFWVTAEGQLSLIHEIGKPGVSVEMSYPGPAARQFASIPVKGSRAAIVVQLSNFHHTWGGMWLPPRIGSSQVLAVQQEKQSNANFLMLGVLIFLAFYSISLYLRRREDRGSLWLTALAMGFVLRIGAYVGSGMSMLSSEAAFVWTLKIIYGSMIWGPVFGYYFFATYFPRQFKPIYARISAWIGLPVLVFLFFAPTDVFGYLGNPLIYIGAASAVFMCFLITRVFLAREVGGTVCFIGMIALMGGTFLEAASALGLVEGIFNAMGYGLVVFVAFQSQIVAARFVQAFRKSEHLGRELQREVDRQTREIRSILDNIKQGIFTVEGSLQTTGPQFSPFTRTMLAKDEIAGKQLDELLWNKARISSDQIDQVHAALSSVLDDDVLNFELNSECFPRELVVMPEGADHAKVLEIDWSPIVDDRQKVEKMLICVRDVTEIRQLRLDAERNQREFTILNEIITITEERFIRFIQKAFEYLQENEFFIQKEAEGTQQVAKRIFVNYHTLKGTARTYHMRLLATETHDVEHFLTAFLKGQQPWNRVELMAGVERMKTCLNTYEKVAREKLQWKLDKKTIKFDRNDLVRLIPHIRELESEVLSTRGKATLATIGTKLLESVYTRLADIILEAGRGLDSIARDLDKRSPEIILTPNHFLMIDDWADRLHGTVTHILRNAIDHGIEKPDERRQNGKDETGHIFVSTQIENGFLRIDLQDDGRGLNLISIEKLGRERGLIPAGAVDDMTIAMCIFQSGFTTKDAITEVSGRGVGMDAVRSHIEEHGGRVALELDSNSIDRQHVSFSIQLFLPPRGWISSHLIEANQEAG